MSETPNEETIVEPTLDEFAAELFGESKPQKETPPTDENANSSTEEVVSDEGEDKQTSSDDESNAEQNIDENGEVETQDNKDSVEETDDALAKEDKEVATQKQSRYQKRVNQLLAKERKANERADDFERRLNEALAKLEAGEKTNTTNNTETTTNETSGQDAPKADALGEDGKPKYPLGEYDPQFMRDTVQHMFEQQKAELETQQQEAAKQQELSQKQAELQSGWNEKLVDAQERYPDFQEKGEQMLSVFEGIDESYGEYLTNTLMEMDSGPDVFYHLSNNLDEAQRIVDGGAKRATIELAKLEARLEAEKTASEAPATPRVTKAKPAVPPQNKGSAVSKPKTPVDTDDLDAFAKELFG